MVQSWAVCFAYIRLAQETANKIVVVCPTPKAASLLRELMVHMVVSHPVFLVETKYLTVTSQKKRDRAFGYLRGFIDSPRAVLILDGYHQGSISGVDLLIQLSLPANSDECKFDKIFVGDLIPYMAPPHRYKQVGDAQTAWSLRSSPVADRPASLLQE